MTQNQKRKSSSPKGRRRPTKGSALTGVRQRRTLVAEGAPKTPFVERTHPFEKSVEGVLSEAEIEELSDSLRISPEQGDLIPKSRGLWKLRWPARGKGKLGGARIIYYLKLGQGRIQLLYAYLKGKKADLTRKELHELRRWV